MSDLCSQDNMVRVRYNGPTGNHLVGSPLRKFSTYGMHTHGDVFCVHQDDQKTAPNVFVLLPAPAVKEVAAKTEVAADERSAEATEDVEPQVEKKARTPARGAKK